MRRPQIPTLLLALVMTATFAFSQAAHAYQSEELDTQTVGPQFETDIIRVDRDYGRASWLRVIPKRNGIYLRRVVVVFGNRTSQVFNVDRLLDPGEETRALKFKGGSRNFSEVRLEYVARSSRKREAVVTVITNPPVSRRGRDLEVIGEGAVKPRRRSGYIPIGRKAGRFNGIAIRATNRPVRIRNIVIDFANGDVRRVPINRGFRAGVRTGLIKFDHQSRKIEGVTVNIVPTVRRRTTRLEVVGRPASRRYDNKPLAQHRGKWVHLGTRKVSLFNKDNDVFRIGKHHGRFSAIRVTAKRHDVRMYGMRITYGNGSIENVPLHGTIEDGHTTPPYDLKGRHRFIDHISFRYRTRLNFKGAAQLELWGLSTQ